MSFAPGYHVIVVGAYRRGTRLGSCGHDQEGSIAGLAGALTGGVELQSSALLSRAGAEQGIPGSGRSGILFWRMSLAGNPVVPENQHDSAGKTLPERTTCR